MSYKLGDSRVPSRLWERVQEEHLTGCWVWQGHKTRGGYGQARVAGIDYVIHRFMYLTLVGLIGNKLQCDHICRNRACCNPAHIELVSNRENTTRGLNSRLKPSKSSKYLGVCWDFNRQKWLANFMFGGKFIYVGRFDNEDAAYAAVLKSKEKYGISIR